MRSSWAVVTLGLGLLSGSVAARGETVVGEYAPVVRIEQHAPAPQPPQGTFEYVSAAPPAGVPTAAPPIPPPVVGSVPLPAPTMNGASAYAVPGSAPSYPAMTFPGAMSEPTFHGGGMGSGCSACGGGMGTANDPCFCGFPCVWGSVGYLHLWMKNGPLPPLVTTGPGTARPTLDRPGTVVISPRSVQDNGRSGMIVTLGFGFPSEHPCDPCCKCGVEFTAFDAAQVGRTFRASSDGLPVLGRPFVDVATGVPVNVVQDVANVLPPVSGTVLVNVDTTVYNVEGNGVCPVCCDCEAGFKVDLLLGVRFLTFTEDLSITERLLNLNGSGEVIGVRDSFTARTRFFGGQIGLRGEKRYGDFFVQATGKVALGADRQLIYIFGETIDNLPGFAPVRAQGGLLAQRTNIGRHQNNEFAAVGEALLAVGYQPADWLRLSVGGNFLYLSSMIRAGDQVDLQVNSNLIPRFAPGRQLPPLQAGPDRPTVMFKQSDYWLSGITANVELRY